MVSIFLRENLFFNPQLRKLLFLEETPISKRRMTHFTKKQNEALALSALTLQIFTSMDVTNEFFHLSFMTNYVSSSNANKPN